MSFFCSCAALMRSLAPPWMKAKSAFSFGLRSMRRFSRAPAVCLSSTVMPWRLSSAA
jgi:hypothetical protein